VIVALTLTSIALLHSQTCNSDLKPVRVARGCAAGSRDQWTFDAGTSVAL